MAVAKEQAEGPLLSEGGEWKGSKVSTMVEAGE